MLASNNKIKARRLARDQPYKLHNRLMASPIFMSNPSPGFSPTAVVKGGLLAISGLYLQRSVVATPKFQSFLFRALVLSLAVRTVAEIPRLVGSTVTLLLRLVSFHADFTPFVTALFHDILNLQTILILLLQCYYHESFETIFVHGLNTLDQICGSDSNYASTLSAAKRIEIHTTSPAWLLKLLSTSQSILITQLVRSYVKISITILLLTLCSYVTSQGYILTSIYVSRSFNSTIGSQLTVVTFIIGLMLPTRYIIQAYAQYQLMILTVRSLLTIPYFQKLRFTDTNVESWIESRIGLMTGFSLVFHFVSWRFDLFAFTVLVFEQLALSFLIFKTTSPLREKVSEHWLLTQTSCPAIFEKLQADNLTKGSTLLSQTLKYEEPLSEPHSRLSTPGPASRGQLDDT